MLSLKSIILGFENSGIELYEKTPTINQNNRVVEVKNSASEHDLILKYLKSSLQTEVLFGLTKVMNNSIKNDNCTVFLPQITELLQSNSQAIEYAAIKTLQQIAKTCPMDVYNESYSEILQRLMFFPSEEYVEIICILFPYISPDNFTVRILPIATQMLKMDDTFQYAACEILVKCNFDVNVLTDGLFLQFLDSQILVSHYLLPITKKGIQKNGQQWFKSFLLPQLTTLSNVKEYSRVGIIKTILSLCTEFSDTGVYSVLLSAFMWAESSESVALEILDNCQFIMQTKKAEFSPKLKEFVLKMQQSSDKNVRIRIIDIVAKHEQILYGSEKHLIKFIKSAAEDSSTEVKAEFLKFIETFAQLAPNNTVKELIFNYFVEFFMSADYILREALISTQYYSMIGTPKLNFLLPYFIRFAQFSGTDWRSFANCVSIFVTFPDETVTSGMKAMGMTVNQAVSVSPFALAESCYSFYTRVASIVKSQQYDWLSQTIIKNYAQSKNHRLRAMFFHLAFIIGNVFPRNLFLQVFWPIILDKLQDKISSVRVAFLKEIPKYFELFRKLCLDEESDILFNISAEFNEDTDPYVADVYHSIRRVINHYVENEVIYRERKQRTRQGSLLPNLPKKTSYSKLMKVPSHNQRYKSRTKSLSIKAQNSSQIMKRSVLSHKY